MNTSFKVSLTVVGFFAILLLTMIGVEGNNAMTLGARQAIKDQELNMLVALDVVNRDHLNFERKGDQLIVNGHVLNDDEKIVDHIQSIVGGLATIFMGDKRIATNIHKPDGTRAVGTSLAPGPVYDAVLKRGEAFRGETMIFGHPYFAAYNPIKNAAGETVGIIFAGILKDVYFEPAYRLLYWLAGCGLTIGVICAAATVWMVRRQLRPLQTIRSAMKQVIKGDLSVNLPFAGRSDDFGQMANAVHTLRDEIQQKQRAEIEAARTRQATEQERQANEALRREVLKHQQVMVAALANGLDHLSKGDLTVRLSQPFSEDYEKLRADFNSTALSLEEALSTIVKASEAIGIGSAEIAQASDDFSKRTEQQAAGLEETASALNMITETVRKTAGGAAQASQLVVNTRAEAKNSGGIVQQAVEAMSKIKASSSQINEIIGVIDQIAFQTNLLALNAGVEAARAGETGKGFAVIASEVRALAQRSSEAAKQIKALISASSTQVEGGVALVGKTGEALTGIISKVAEIDVLVREISSSSKEQAVGLSEVNTAVSQMDQVVQQNAAMVEESTAAAVALKNEVHDLSAMVARFQISGGSSVRSRRAA